MTMSTRASLFGVEPARLKKLATYEDLVALPENLVGEIVDGELYASPRPASPHAVAAAALGEELGPPFKRGRGGPGGWFILFEPELHVGGQVLVPDLAGWRRERMPVIPDVAFFEIAPDWVSEVVSPSTVTLDRHRKMPHYLRAGVRHIWIVDPIAKMLEVYRSENERWTLIATHSDDDKVRAEPFDAIEIDLAILWAR
jgi:Uma2 family endonuclease